MIRLNSAVVPVSKAHDESIIVILTVRYAHCVSAVLIFSMCVFQAHLFHSVHVCERERECVIDCN